MQDGSVARFAAMLAALSQATRLRIVGVVSAGGKDGTPAGEIARAVHCPASTLSFHLKELTQAGLLSAEPQGRFIRYSAVPDALHELAEFIRQLPGTPAGKPADPPAAQRRKDTRRPTPAGTRTKEGQLSIFDE